ncbi:MAG: Type 1 glutamine amidotransferase-like domain-containing protein [Patescibacteria group bacterium]
MKFLLTSIYANVADELPKLISDKPESVTVAFIATAADVYEDKSFVDIDRNKLKEQGFQIKEVNLKSANSADLEKEMADCGVIFVAGGNIFYLLQEVRKSGFDTILSKLGLEVIYVGSSAGSVLVGPDVGLVDTLDNPLEAPELKDYTGLNLIDFVVLPHYGKPKYEEKYQAIIKKATDQGLKTKTLGDSEFVVVRSFQGGSKC